MFILSLENSVLNLITEVGSRLNPTDVHVQLYFTFFNYSLDNIKYRMKKGSLVLPAFLDGGGGDYGNILSSSFDENNVSEKSSTSYNSLSNFVKKPTNFLGNKIQPEKYDDISSRFYKGFLILFYFYLFQELIW
jgi:hypothetical protein